MKFCDLNLHDYIHPENSLASSESISSFIREASSASSLQIWVVMNQIIIEVKYIHRKSHIHRDIKPANGAGFLFYDWFNYIVLYSCKDGLWKLANFGLTIEGSSRTNLLTQYARRTQGYRALEFLESNNEPTYTNKVDIWSMNCILYELAIGKYVFNFDWAFFLYRFS